MSPQFTRRLPPFLIEHINLPNQDRRGKNSSISSPRDLTKSKGGATRKERNRKRDVGGRDHSWFVLSYSLRPPLPGQPSYSGEYRRIGIKSSATTSSSSSFTLCCAGSFVGLSFAGGFCLNGCHGGGFPRCFLLSIGHSPPAIPQLPPGLQKNRTCL